MYVNYSLMPWNIFGKDFNKIIIHTLGQRWQTNALRKNAFSLFEDLHD